MFTPHLKKYDTSGTNKRETRFTKEKQQSMRICVRVINLELPPTTNDKTRFNPKPLKNQMF